MSATLTRERPVATRRDAVPASHPRPIRGSERWWHVCWLAASFPFAFAVPFLFADVLSFDRDLFYGVYAFAVGLFVVGWSRATRLTRHDLLRNARWGMLLGAAGAAATTLVVLRTEDVTDHPRGITFAAALLWRGVVYGVTDGVLLSVFPILAVFGAFAGTRLRGRRRGTAAVGALALAASVGLTAVYHLGYSDFRSGKVRKPVAGSVLWSAPTLLTLSPIATPLAHVGMHVGAVVHSYDTETFLPPHGRTTAVVAARREVAVYFLRGEQLASAVRSAPAFAPATETMRRLLAGPAVAERRDGLTSAVPAGTRIRALWIAGGTATVDFSARFASGGGSLSMAARLAQVTYTLTQFPTVQRVNYLLNGHPIAALGGEGVIVSAPQTRAQYENARSDSLEGGLLPAVFVDRPARGGAFTDPLVVSGSATRTFTITVVDWDGRIVAERTVRNDTAGRVPFGASIAVARGRYPRGALIVRTGARVVEIPLGHGGPAR